MVARLANSVGQRKGLRGCMRTPGEVSRDVTG
jgi:hypothetical protein